MGAKEKYEDLQERVQPNLEADNLTSSFLSEKAFDLEALAN